MSVNHPFSAQQHVQVHTKHVNILDQNHFRIFGPVNPQLWSRCSVFVKFEYFLKVKTPSKQLVLLENYRALLKMKNFVSKNVLESFRILEPLWEFLKHRQWLSEKVYKLPHFHYGILLECWRLSWRAKEICRVATIILLKEEYNPVKPCSHSRSSRCRTGYIFLCMEIFKH